MYPIRLSALALIALAISGGTAEAATISQSVAGLGAFHLPKFDPALGTLNSVAAELFGFSEVLGNVGYFPPPPEDPNDLILSGFATVYAEGGFVSASLPGLPVAVGLAGSPRTEPIHPGEVRTLLATSDGLATNSTFDVSPYVGLDEVLFFIDGILAEFIVDPAPYIRFEGTVGESIVGSLTLTYNYTPIPEPRTLLLAALASAVLCLRNRRLANR